MCHQYLWLYPLFVSNNALVEWRCPCLAPASALFSPFSKSLGPSSEFDHTMKKLSTLLQCRQDWNVFFRWPFFFSDYATGLQILTKSLNLVFSLRIQHLTIAWWQQTPLVAAFPAGKILAFAESPHFTACHLDSFKHCICFRSMASSRLDCKPLMLISFCWTTFWNLWRLSAKSL